MADLPEKKVLKLTPDDIDNDKIDRLSALPDCVLLHILSLLNTKHAAATSILSTRWRNLFVCLPDMDFSFFVDNVASDRDRLFSDFINFANRVIQQRNKAPIRKIRLYVKCFVGRYRMAFESMLISIAAAISWSNVEVIDMPCQCMKLMSDCPYLTHLEFLQYASEIEEGIEVKVVDISSPSLRKLLLYCSQEVESEFTIFVKSENLKVLSCFLKGQHKVTMDAPNLTSLSIDGHVLGVNIIQNLMSLDNAKVHAGFLYYMTTESNLFLRSQHAFKFFSGLQIVKSLCLSEDILVALLVSQLVLPTFKNLIKLELRPSGCYHFPHICISKVLSSLFESSPKLEVLIFSEVLKNYFSEARNLILFFKMPFH